MYNQRKIKVAGRKMRQDRNPKNSSSGFVYYDTSRLTSSQGNAFGTFGQSTSGLNTSCTTGSFSNNTNVFAISPPNTNISKTETTTTQTTTTNTITNIVTTSTSSFGSLFGNLKGTSTSAGNAVPLPSTSQAATSIFRQKPNTCTTTNTNLFSTSSLTGTPLCNPPFGMSPNGFGISNFNSAGVPNGLTINEAKEKNTNTEQKPVIENKMIPLQSHIPLVNVSYCKTFLKSKKYKFTWKIENFKETHRLEDTLIADNLQSESLPYEIHMKVFRASDLHDNNKNNTSLLKDKIAFYILPEIAFKCTFAVNIIKDSKYIQCKVASGTGSIPGSNQTLLYETTAEELYKMLYKEHTLLIEFSFEVYRRCSLSTTYINSATSKEDSHLKSKDLNFDKYCKSDDEQSIKFIVSKNDYIVPIKQLLATNSSYFEEICNNKEKEKDITDEIISERKQAIFAIMVSFIKTGLIPAIIDVNDLKDLLKLAHKFDVQTLKLVCEECLLSYVTLSTAIDFLQLAISCEAKCLEKNVENFLKIHIQDIISLKEFHLLSPEHSQKIIKIKEEAENDMFEELLN